MKSRIERVTKEKNEGVEREREGERYTRGQYRLDGTASASTLFPEGMKPRDEVVGTDIRPNDCHVITG